MNDSQTTAGSTSNQYGQTQSPQTPGGQSLSNEAAGNLQTVSTPNLFTGQDSVSITQVGDGNFTPYSPENTTQATISAPAPPKNHHYPVIIGSSILIIAILVVSWLMIRRQSTY